MSGNNGQNGTKSQADILHERLVADEAERYVLGAVIMGHERPDTLTRELRKTDFYRVEHRLIFEAIAAIGPGVSPMAVLERARAMGERANGVKGALLTEMVQAVGYRSWAEMVGVVRRRAAQRGMADAARHVLGELANGDLDDEMLVDEIDGRWTSATAPLRRQDGPYCGPHDPERLAKLVLRKLEDDAAPDVFVSLTPSMDRYARAPVGAPTFIGADTGDGKSSFAMTRAEMWADAGEQVVYHTFEDKAEAMHYRQLGARMGIGFDALTKAIYGNRNEKVRQCIRAWEDHFRRRDGTVLIDDTAGATGPKLRLLDRAYARDGYTRFVYDHLGDMPPPSWLRGRDDPAIFRYNAQALRDLIKELNVVGVVLSQLNEQGKKAKHPTVRGFFMSGIVTQTARLAVILRRPDRERADSRWHHVELHVVKATNGNETPKGWPVQLVMEPQRTWIREPWPHEKAILMKQVETPLYTLLAKYDRPHTNAGLLWPGEPEPAATGAIPVVRDEMGMPL